MTVAPTPAWTRFAIVCNSGQAVAARPGGPSVGALRSEVRRK
jgi:hypothetical protein